MPVVSQVCPECAKLSEHGEYHPQCKEGIALKGIIASAYFEEGPVREMIHNLKYNGVTELAEPLAKLMSEALEKSEIRILKSEQNIQKKNSQFDIRHSDFVISYVPLHWHRQATRGYNQAELLAKIVGEKTGLEVLDLLKKVKNTTRQAELSGEKRRKNLKGVFRPRKSPKSLKNLTIILIDDVCTTGSTLNECARVLKKAGAKEVWGLVVCRG